MSLPVVKDVRFGVEVETVTRMMPEIDLHDMVSNCDRLAALIERYFLERGIDLEQQGSVDVFLRARPIGYEYKTWMIQEDDTIETTWGDPDLYPLEYATPILVHEESEVWKSKFKNFWQALKTFAYISSNDSCSTHVHMSTPGEWHVEHLRRLSKALIYFEPALGMLPPAGPSRRNWAICNRTEHYRFKEMSTMGIFKEIDAVDCVEDFPLLMNYSRPPNGTPTKYFAWNFKELAMGGCGSVEFRIGPGSTCFEECEPWVELAVTFLRAAANFGTTETLLGLRDDVDGLKTFLSYALPDDEKRSLKRFGNIFDAKTGKFIEVKVKDDPQ